MDSPSWELVGVPYTSMKHAGGIAGAIAALRSCGLAGRLGAVGVSDGGDLELGGPSGERGPSGLLNETAVVELVAATRERVSAVHARGRVPLLVGGDCPVVLGPLAALRDAGNRPGLVMIDGHEDAWPPRRSDTGEASDSEVAIALDLAPDLPDPLGHLVPLLQASAVAQLGPRDAGELAEAGVPSLRDRIAFFVDDNEIAGERTEQQMGTALDAIEADAFWLHVDLDCLSSAAFAAVDYRQPGGLSWRQLDDLAALAANDPRCRGVSVVIYNPDLDPDRGAAAELIEFVARLVDAC